MSNKKLNFSTSQPDLGLRIRLEDLDTTQNYIFSQDSYALAAYLSPYSRLKVDSSPSTLIPITGVLSVDISSGQTDTTYFRFYTVSSTEYMASPSSADCYVNTIGYGLCRIPAGSSTSRSSAINTYWTVNVYERKSNVVKDVKSRDHYMNKENVILFSSSSAPEDTLLGTLKIGNPFENASTLGEIVDANELKSYFGNKITGTKVDGVTTYVSQSLLNVENNMTFSGSALNITGTTYSSGNISCGAAISSVGNISSSGVISAVGNVNSSASMIAQVNVAAFQDVNAGIDVNATEDVNAGVHISAGGNVVAGGSVTAGINVIATGYVQGASIRGGVGAVGTPSLTFVGNTTTGLYHSGGINFSVSGAKIGTIATDGLTINKGNIEVDNSLITNASTFLVLKTDGGGLPVIKLSRNENPTSIITQNGTQFQICFNPGSDDYLVYGNKKNIYIDATIVGIKGHSGASGNAVEIKGGYNTGSGKGGDLTISGGISEYGVGGDVNINGGDSGNPLTDGQVNITSLVTKINSGIRYKTSHYFIAATENISLGREEHMVFVSVTGGAGNPKVTLYQPDPTLDEGSTITIYCTPGSVENIDIKNINDAALVTIEPGFMRTFIFHYESLINQRRWYWTEDIGVGRGDSQ